jgi:hypothetical protein
MAWGFLKDRKDSANDNPPTPVHDLDKINKDYMANMDINPPEEAAINPPELEPHIKPLNNNNSVDEAVIITSSLDKVSLPT